MKNKAIKFVKAGIIIAIALAFIVPSSTVSAMFMWWVAPAAQIAYETQTVTTGIEIYYAGWNLLLIRAFLLCLAENPNQHIFWFDGYRCCWACTTGGGVWITYWNPTTGKSGQIYLPPSQVPPGLCPTCG